MQLFTVRYSWNNSEYKKSFFTKTSDDAVREFFKWKEKRPNDLKIVSCNSLEKLFTIHHATGLYYTEDKIQPRVVVGFIMASSIQDAYIKSQNSYYGDGMWNEANPCRSTSVGDMIQEGNEFHLVAGMGFKMLTADELDKLKYWETMNVQAFSHPIDEDAKNESELNGLENQSSEC
jgi:hypothetical protein